VITRYETLLVVVDFQERLLPSIHDAGEMLRRAERLIRGARLLDIPILITEQYPRGLGSTAEGVIDALGDAYRPIEKAAMSTMGEPAFAEALAAAGRRQVLLCGIEAHVCVYQSAAQMREQGYDVHLVADCTSSRCEADARIAIDRMQQLGCRLTTHEMAIFEMLRVSGTSEFKAWVQIIR